MLTQEIANLLNAQQVQTGARTPSAEMDKQAFLALLVKQLSNQDPLDPMGNEEFVSQLAQFGSLEQAINLNDSFEQFLSFQQLTQASTLIGKKVIAFVMTDQGVVPTSGVVEQVMLLNGVSYVKLSTGDEIPLTSIVSVEQADEQYPAKRGDA